MSGGNRLVGTVAEVALAGHIGGRCNLRESSYQYDVVAPNGTTFEVKGKLSNYCRGDDECSVAAFNIGQRADYYAFARVRKDYSLVTLVGFYPQREYVRDARFLKKGDTDGSNRFTVRADCYNMYHYQLRELEV
jgi:hypothetical protein